MIIQRVVDAVKGGVERPNIFDKPIENMFDVKSGKDLRFVLKHGYSFNMQERKLFKAKKSAIVYKKLQREFLNATLQNRSVMEDLRSKDYDKTDFLNSSQNAQSIYADLFNDRYRKLAQSIIESTDQDPNGGDKERKIERMASENMHTAKTNGMYKELGMNLNLKELFGEFSKDELLKLRKLHVLYAAQKGKQRKTLK